MCVDSNASANLGKKLYNGPVEERSFRTLKIFLLLLFLRRKI